jgi:hypothetical protein
VIFVVAFGTVQDVMPSMRNNVPYRIWRWKLGPLLIVIGKVVREP